MAQQLTIDNYGSLNIIQRDQLAADTLVGDQTITVPNTNGYTTNQHAIIGAIGVDTSELVQFQSTPSATTVHLVAPLRLPHQRFDKLTLIFGDQIRIYRAPNTNGLVPDDSTFTVLQTLTINYDEQTTYYTDAAGSDAFWYKFTYYDSTSGAETNLAESVAGRGGGYSFYASLDQIRKTAGMVDNPYITDADINQYRVEAQQEIHNALQGMYDIPFKPPIDPMLTGITRLLAAGKLMMDNPGTMGRSSAIYLEGEDKAQQARDMLTLIDNRQYFLTNGNGETIISPNSQSSKSWPNVTTPSVSPDQGGSRRNFSIADVQEGTRRY